MFIGLNPQALAAIFVAVIVGVLSFGFYMGQTDEVVSTTNDAAGNLTGTNNANARTIVNNMPLFYVLGGLLLIISIAFGIYKGFGGSK